MLFPFWYDTMSDKPLPSIRYRPGPTQAGAARYCKRQWFFVTTDADNITGQAYNVDGGAVMIA